MNRECVELIEALCDMARGTFRVYKMPADGDEWPALRGSRGTSRAGWSCLEYGYGEQSQRSKELPVAEEWVWLFARAINQDLVTGAWFSRDDPEDYKVASVPGRNSTMLTCLKGGKTFGCLIKAGFPRDLGSEPWLSGQGYMYYCERLLFTSFKQVQRNVLAGEFVGSLSAAMDILRDDFGFRHEPIPQPI